MTIENRIKKITFYIKSIMKCFNFKSVAAASICAAALIACQKEQENNNRNNGTELKGYVTEDLTLEAGKTYELAGSLQVKAPATLTIGAGATVIAKDNGEINYILIEQGAKIHAVGTKDAPIVLTAERKENGAWGGVHICGRAHSNAGTNNTSEIGNAPYGGNVENDNSGVMKYVRIEYSGYALDSEHEANGLSLYGVGNGTSLSYIQCINGSDDGIEFFGGSVNIDHCVIIDCTDDSFDWTEGWNGNGEWLVAYQSDHSCDCLFECDNNGKAIDATPVSNPKLDHVTLVGNNGKDTAKGIRLRAGTRANFSNTLVCGKPNPIVIETEPTVKSFVSGESKFSNVIISGKIKSDAKVSEAYTDDMFTQSGKNKTDTEITLKSRFIGTVDGAGAVPQDNDWTAGWTK